MCTCGLRCRSAFSIKSSIFREIVAYQDLLCVACSRLSDSRMTHNCKARENVSAWPSLLSFYFRVRALSIPRTWLSRSLEQAMFCVVTLLVINLSNHENDNGNEKIKTNNKSHKKKRKTLNLGHTFWQVSLPSLHDQRCHTSSEWQWCRRLGLYDRRFSRELKQQGRWRLRKRHLESEFARLQTLSRLFQLVQFSAMSLRSAAEKTFKF